MSDSAKPTIEILLSVWTEDYSGDDITLIEDWTTGTWRHGSEHRAIFHRRSDDTHWAVRYRSNPGGDYNDFREGDLSDSDVAKVAPYEVIVTRWRDV